MKISKTGYKKNSKDKNEPALLIPSNKITMDNVDFPVFGISDTGDSKMMYPGLNYSFKGNYVYEFPVKKEGGYALPGRFKNPEGNWVSKYANGGDISIPDLSGPNWLDKYQDAGEVSNQNGLIYESPTEPGLYESKYSLNPVNVTPNWTKAELERNRIRDEYIEKDKKVWAHWYDKLGYDRKNVEKRANQYAYNTLAKQYLKGEKENLTPEQRKFIERSEYAQRLQPSVQSRFFKGLGSLALDKLRSFVPYLPSNPESNLETLSDLAAPLEYPTNLVRGAVVGEFGDALMGETPSPYFVSSDRTGSSPTEAAIMSGLIDFGVDAGLGALGEVVPLSKGINAAGKYLNNKYTKISKTLTGSPNSTNLQSKVIYPKVNQPLPEYMEPYLGQVTKEISGDEKRFRSFLSPEARAELEAEDIIRYNPDGTIKKKYGGRLDNYKKGGAKSQGEGYYDYINGYSGIFANGGTKSKENSWLNKYK